MEPIHAVVYFAPEKKPLFERIGLKGGWMAYFASRAAPMGPVAPDVVVATFYNFHPKLVRRAIPDAWNYASPSETTEARREVAARALTRLCADVFDTVSVAGVLARRAIEGCGRDGRPLFAAHASLDWPADPLLALWHACTLLREYRGDGHVAALVANEIDGCEANVLVAADGITPAEMLREYRWWSEADWRKARERLQERGWVDDLGHLTPDGVEARRSVEDLTDRLALPPLATMTAEAWDALERALTPVAAAVVARQGISFPNPIGLTTTQSGSLGR